MVFVLQLSEGFFAIVSSVHEDNARAFVCWFYDDVFVGL